MKSIYATINKVAKESSVVVRQVRKRVKMTDEERRESKRRSQREYSRRHRDKLRSQGISLYSTISQKTKQNKYAKLRVKGGDGPKSRGLVRLYEAGVGVDDSPENTLPDFVWQFGHFSLEGRGGFNDMFIIIREFTRIEEDYRPADDIPLSAVERREASGVNTIYPIRQWREMELSINEHG